MYIYIYTSFTRTQKMSHDISFLSSAWIQSWLQSPWANVPFLKAAPHQRLRCDLLHADDGQVS